jgi:hypothetical protein
MANSEIIKDVDLFMGVRYTDISKHSKQKEKISSSVRIFMLDSIDVMIMGFKFTHSVSLATRYSYHIIVTIINIIIIICIR